MALFPFPSALHQLGLKLVTRSTKNDGHSADVKSGVVCLKGLDQTNYEQAKTRHCDGLVQPYVPADGCMLSWRQRGDFVTLLSVVQPTITVSSSVTKLQFQTGKKNVMAQNLLQHIPIRHAQDEPKINHSKWGRVKYKWALKTKIKKTNILMTEGRWQLVCDMKLGMCFCWWS